jgi:outer membrane cobalamin receptor
MMLCVPAAFAGAEPAAPDSGNTEPVETLAAFVVMAGRMPVGASPGAILNSTEIISTPGAAADINRSLQTFPGVQQVDEGNALFVRGGDSAETATLVNGIRYASASQINAPLGSFSTTIDPLQTRSVTFLNGNLSAQYGNALSGIVDLTTQGPPSSTSGMLNLGLGAAEGTGNLALGHQAGLRATTTLSDVAPVIGLNGTKRTYLEKPNGHNLSTSAAWAYRPGGEIRFYGADQVNHFALLVDQPELQGSYRNRVHSQLATLSWKDEYEAWKWQLNAGRTGFWRTEDVAIADIVTRDTQWQANAALTRDLSGKAAVTVGVDMARDAFGLAKSKEIEGVRRGFDRSLVDERSGAFVQADAVVMPHVRAIVGGRLDHSKLAGATADPRVSLAWEPREDLSFSVGGGSYHQVPDGYYFFGAQGERLSRPAMRAQDAVAAVEYRGESSMVRVEAYQKHYGALSQLGLNRVPAETSGGGEAKGLDLFFKTALPADFSARLTCSFLEAKRSVPGVSGLAPAPWDIGQSVTAVIERPVAGWNMSLALHYAQGRPVTPVVGGLPFAGGWEPDYGAPYSERVPPLRRVDFLAHRTWFLNSGRSVTAYVSINNLLNHPNVYGYGYSADYTRRHDVPSYFSRILYFGVMIFFY